VSGVTLLAPPFPLPDVELSIAWHRRYDTDGAHAWLRRHVAAILTP
jgi:hypothetical protein